jgi:DNA-binding transcriptional ArsR family regulator
MMRLGNAAAVFAALGDDTRLHLVARLSSGGPQSIVALTDAVDVSRQAVTKHLVALAEAGLVRSEKAGRERIWELDTRRLGDAQRYLDEISSQWDRAVDRLRAFVETDD